MATPYSADRLLSFLQDTADRGAVPPATARALMVASRRLIEVLNTRERADLRQVAPAAVAARFAKKHADDFSAASLTEYGRRFQRALELFKRWGNAPADVSVPTRSTAAARRRARAAAPPEVAERQSAERPVPARPTFAGGERYESSFPLRAGVVVRLANVPLDLSKAEAERLAQFVRMLSIE